MNKGHRISDGFPGMINQIAGQAEPVKGVTTKAQIMTKSFADGIPEGQKSPLPEFRVVQEALQKSFQEGEVDSTTISKWELGHYDPALLSPQVIQKISKHFPNQEVN